MKLSSSAFAQGQSIPTQYTCEGANISPPLHIDHVPENTQSLVLIMDDPDVPSYIRPDRNWDHWLVYNIPADTTHIPEGQEPAGIHGRGTNNNLNYFGPCPPDKEHRYFFKLYALDTLLSLAEGASKAAIETAIKGHLLAETSLMGTYEKQQS